MTRMVPRLKWHMLRRRRSDPGHLRANLALALEEGAVCEVDIRFTVDGHAFCLHDDTLDRETTGQGSALPLRRAEIERLFQRAGDGTALASPPLFLDEIVATARSAGGSTGGLVQLDVKAPLDALDDAGLQRMAEIMAMAAPRFIVGACDWRTAKRLAAAIPGLQAGFDPLELYPRAMPQGAVAFRALGERTLAIAPDAAMFYLEGRLVLAGLAEGVNLIEIVTRNGAEVDVWTLDADRPDLRDALGGLIRAGCHQVTSNDPVVLRPLIEEIAACL